MVRPGPGLLAFIMLTLKVNMMKRWPRRKRVIIMRMINILQK